MTVYLSSFGGAGWQFFDDNGDPLSGGKIYSYDAGTTTPAPTYTSSNGSTPHSNPIILDAAGRVATGEIWVPTGKLYKYVLASSTDTLIGTFDNIGTIASGAATISNFTGNGTQMIFTLSFAPLGANATNVYINGVYQQKNTYAVFNDTITFSEAPPPTSTIEVAYF